MTGCWQVWIGLLTLILVAGKSAGAAPGDFWWHYLLTQSGRNDAIVRTALSYPNYTFFSGECKGWVRQVVLQASQGAVVIPPNTNDWSWEASPNVVKYFPQYPASGTIIQMRWRSESGNVAHTMIVVSSGWAGMNVIDCNWYNRSNYSRIFRHSITWADFRARAVAYSVYYVK